MRCPGDERLLLLAAGEEKERGRRRLERHLRDCRRCREEYEVSRRAVRHGFPALARGRGLLSDAPDDRVAEILRAVARRSEHEIPGDAISRPRRRKLLVPAAVAATLLIAAFMARYLGEPRWNGCPEEIWGTPLLSRDGERFEPLQPGMEIGPGDVLVAVEGGGGTFSIPDAGRIRIDGPAAVVFGPGGGAPYAILVQGVMSVEGSAGRSLPAGAGELAFTVRGRAELQVEAEPADAFESAVRLAQGFRPRFGLRRAEAAVAEASRSIRVHSLHGEVRPARAEFRPLRAGEEATLAAADLCPEIAWIGSGPIYAAPILGRTTERERASLHRLVPPGSDAVRALLRTAADPRAPEEDRALSVWLLAEFGDPAAGPALRRLLSDDDSPAVQAAAAHALGRMEDWDAVSIAALRRVNAGARPEVAEALVQALFRSPREGVAKALAEYAGEGGRPPFVRALAAAVANKRGAPLSDRALLSLLGEAPDGLTAPLLITLLDPVDPETRLALLDVASRPGPGRAAAFELLGRLGVDGTGDAAALALAEEPAGRTWIAAFACLASDPERLCPIVRRVLDGSDPALRLAALEALGGLAGNSPLRDEFLPDLRAAAADPDAPDEAAIAAMQALGGRNDASALVMRVGSPNAGVRVEALTDLVLVAAEDPTLAGDLACQNVLLLALDDPAEAVREKAAEALARIHPALAVRRLTGTASATPAGIVRATLDGLRVARFPGDPESRASIAGWIAAVAAGAEPDLRITALGLLGDLLAGGDAPDAAEYLVRFLRIPDAPESLRAMAARSLALHADRSRPEEWMPAVLAEGGEPARVTAHLVSRDAARLGANLLLLEALAHRSDRPFCRAVLAAIRGGPELAAFLAGGPDEAVESLLGIPTSPFLAGHEEPILRLLASDPRRIRLLAVRSARALRLPAERLRGCLDGADPLVFLGIAGLVCEAGGAVDPDRLGTMLATLLGTPGSLDVAAWFPELAGAADLAAVLRTTREREGDAAFGARLLMCFETSAEFRRMEIEATGEAGIRATEARAGGLLVAAQNDRLRAHAREVLSGSARGSVAEAATVVRTEGSRVDAGLLLSLWEMGAGGDAREALRDALRSLLAVDVGACAPPRGVPDWSTWWSGRRYALEVPVVPRTAVESP